MPISTSTHPYFKDQDISDTYNINIDGMMILFIQLYEMNLTHSESNQYPSNNRKHL